LRPLTKFEIAANCLIPYHMWIMRKKNVLNTCWLFSRFSNSKMSLNKGPFTIFNMEPMKEMAPTTLVQTYDLKKGV